MALNTASCFVHVARSLAGLVFRRFQTRAHCPGPKPSSDTTGLKVDQPACTCWSVPLCPSIQCEAGRYCTVSALQFLFYPAPLLIHPRPTPFILWEGSARQNRKDHSPIESVQLSGFEYIDRAGQPSAQSNFRTFSSPTKETLNTLAAISSSPFPQPNQLIIYFLSLETFPFWIPL